MKRFLWSAALLWLGTPGWADQVEGIWRTSKDYDGYSGDVEIRPCGPAFCGILIRAFDRRDQEVFSESVGKMIVIDMVAYPDGLYDDGQVYSPDSDKTYNGELRLSGDKLKVRGCVLGICRNGGIWRRIK